MEYNILKHNKEEMFVELTRQTYRTRIEFNWVPEENFSGVAVCCNYHYKGHPLGYIKDNSLVMRQIDGKKQRGIFLIPDTNTVIQAGPKFIESNITNKDFKKEGIATHEILKGFHVHLARRKSGNLIVGYTLNSTFHEIIAKYRNIHVYDAIKLPGHKNGAFIFKTKAQYVQYGLVPIPVALIFEPRLKKVTDDRS